MKNNKTFTSNYGIFKTTFTQSYTTLEPPSDNSCKLS